jgi:hypothetical protein
MKKDLIVARLNKGIPYGQIAKEVQCSKATISYHAKKLGLSKGRVVHYDWKKVQEFHNNGHRRLEVTKHFGMAKATWDKARKTGRIKVNEWRVPLSQLLVKNGKLGLRGHIKKQLIQVGLLKNKCSICGLTDWQKKPIVCRIDHINGKNNDYRISNLRIVCPNCDSQLPTFSGRNIKRRIIQE